MLEQQYVVKELINNINKIRFFHVIHNGIPVGILTNKHDHSSGVNSHQDWRVFSLNNTKQHQPWSINERFTLTEAIERLQEIDPSDLIFASDPENPDCIIKYHSAFGAIEYRAIDENSGYPYFTNSANRIKPLPKDRAINIANDKNDVLGRNMSFAGDRVVKIEVVTLNTSEVVFSQDLESNARIYKESTTRS